MWLLVSVLAYRAQRDRVAKMPNGPYDKTLQICLIIHQQVLENMDNFISSLISSSGLTNRSMRAELAEETQSQQHLYCLLSAFWQPRVKWEDGASALGGAAALISTSSLRSLLWDNKITAAPGENQLPAGAIVPCWLPA